MWKKRLASIVNFPDRGKVEQFISGTAIGAMESLQQSLVQQEWPTDVLYDEDHGRTYIKVIKPGQINFLYEIHLREYTRPSFAFPEMNRSNTPEDPYYRAEVFLSQGGQTYDVYGYHQQEIIGDILDHFEKYLHFLHIGPGQLPWNMAEHDEMLHDPSPAVVKD